MENLLKQLDHIYELLEQIEALTTNQTTVLLQEKIDFDAEIGDLDILNDMADYKEAMIDELIKIEDAFQESYSPYKGKITDKKIIAEMKERIKRIMKKKQAITDAEQNNLLIMQSYANRKDKQTIIPKQASEVAAAYKKQQLNGKQE